MVARQRDLDAFAYDGDGDSFVLNGVEPERRAPLAATYGKLTLRNGVPVGYLQADVVGRSAALSFNTFETFRGGESAYVFARMLAMLHHVFGATSFTLDSYQLGSDNDEAIASGAWWFYFKLGFAPRAAGERDEPHRFAGDEPGSAEATADGIGRCACRHRLQAGCPRGSSSRVIRDLLAGCDIRRSARCRYACK